MEALKIGILGTGVIAATLADTMNRMPGVELYGGAATPEMRRLWPSLTNMRSCIRRLRSRRR